MNKITIPNYFKCTKCGIHIAYEEACEMECGQCVFDDWKPMNNEEKGE
jgi:hypothetical protein